MPVVSPSRYSSTTSSTLSSGSYRSTITSSSSLDKPYYRSSSGTYVTSTSRNNYGDKTTEYRSRYTDVDGKRERKSSLVEYTRTSRAPSVSDSDSGIATRYRSERSESRSRDISTTRSDSGKSISEPLPRPKRSVISTAALAMSTAELYNKYSPANYVPLTQRLAQAEISRSKSISGDIGRPPAPEVARAPRKSRNSTTISERPESSSQRYKEGSPTSTYAKRGVNGVMDTNGNEVPSVSEIRKRFDPKMTVTKLPTNEPRPNLARTKNSSSSKSRESVPVHSKIGTFDKNCDWDKSSHSISKTMSEPVSLAKPMADKIEKSKSLSEKSSTKRSTSNKNQSDKGKSVLTHVDTWVPDASFRKSKSNDLKVDLQLGLDEPANSGNHIDSSNVQVNNPGPSTSKTHVEINNEINEELNKMVRKENTTKYANYEVDVGIKNDVDSLGENHYENKTCGSRESVPVHSKSSITRNGDRDSDSNHSINKAMLEPVSLVKPMTDKIGKPKSLNGKSSSKRSMYVKTLDLNNIGGEKVLGNSVLTHINTWVPDVNCRTRRPNGFKNSAELESNVSNVQLNNPGPSTSKTHVEINNEINDELNKIARKKNTIKYIDCEADGGIEPDADSPSENGFENKTFEHENYLMKRNEDERRMDTSTESIASDNTDSSPESPATRRRIIHYNEELAGGKSGPSGLRRSSERCYNNDDIGPHYNGLNGLRNIGNTCFMNSVLQCLSNTRPLLEYVSEDKYMSEINTTLSCMKGALIKAFGSVIKELWRPGERDTVVNTTTFKSQVQRFAPRFMGYSQQDAQEFLRYLLEGLHEDVNRVTLKPKPILTEIDDNLSDSAKATEAWSRYLRMEDSRIGDIFMGQLKSTLRCTHCQHDSVTFDPFWDLSLPIPSRTSNHKLQQCLQHFTREEEMDGDEKPTCSKCGVRRKCLKWFTVQKFPQVLVLHLKRFSPTERFRGKLNVLVEFPLNGLDMSPYAANKGQEATYNLYAVSNHSGTTYSGHYTAYCKHPYGGDWHEYNDSRVSPISARNVASSEAYVLFYELAKPTTT